MKKGIKAATIARTIVLYAALLNQVLSVVIASNAALESSAAYRTISVLFTLSAAIVSWWKNNSFTDAAVAADEYLEQIRNERN